MFGKTKSIRKAGLIIAELLCFLAFGGNPAGAQTKLVAFEDEQGNWGYKDASGRVVIKPQFTLADDFHPEGIAAVVDGRGWAYINEKGKVVIRPFIFDNGPDYFREGLARFEVDGKFGFFDRKGKVVIPPRFDFALPFQEGLSAVCMGCKKEKHEEHDFWAGGKYGYINRKGEIVIGIRLEEAMPFEKGTAEVKLNGKPALIDKHGHILKTDGR